MDSAIVEKAKEAVNLCNIAKFIDVHDLTIYEKLLRLYLEATKGDPFNSLIFISNSLEVASHIVHLGTSRWNYTRGIEWAKGEYPDADPQEILAALVLIYLINSTESEKGERVLKEAGDEVNKMLKDNERINAEDVWNKLREIVERALNPRPGNIGSGSA